jgi:hypothetical protein
MPDDDPVTEKVCGLRHQGIMNALDGINSTLETQSMSIKEIQKELCGKPGNSSVPLKEEVHRNTWWRHWHQRIWYLVLTTILVSAIAWGVNRRLSGPPKPAPPVRISGP